jgi:hypothetical protein
MKRIFGISLLTLGGVTQAGAETIGFEETLPTYFGLSSYSEAGYTVTSNVPEGTVIDVNNDVRGNLGVFYGGTDSQTLVWGENGTVSTISLANDLGKGFRLNSFDASSLVNLTGELTLTGNLVLGGTVNQVVSLNDSLATYNFAGLGTLSSLDISFDGSSYFGPFDLDNINVTTVPLPAAVWLFGSALGMLGWARRRR